MKDSLKVERDMERVLSGGQMEVGMKDSLEKECKVDMVHCLEMEE